MKEAVFVGENGARESVRFEFCTTTNPKSKMLPKYWKMACMTPIKLQGSGISEIKIQLNKPDDYYDKNHKEKNWLNVTIDEFKVFVH